MTGIQNHAEDIGMFVDILTDHEESSLDLIPVEDLQHFGRDFGNRSVVKGEIHRSQAPLGPPKGG